MKKNQMTDFTIKFSISSEQKKVRQVLLVADWYNKHQYRIILPKGIALKSGKKNIREAMKVVGEQFQVHVYQKYSEKLKKDLGKKLNKFTEKMDEFKLPRKSFYEIILTRYGTAGSYELPNRVIINIVQRKSNRATIVIFHEIIHLSIERLVRKYKVSHWNKELLVDLIMNKIFGGLYQSQNISKNKEKMDSLFKSYFPDIEKILKKIE